MSFLQGGLPNYLHTECLSCREFTLVTYMQNVALSSSGSLSETQLSVNNFRLTDWSIFLIKQHPLLAAVPLQPNLKHRSNIFVSVTAKKSLETVV